MKEPHLIPQNGDEMDDDDDETITIVQTPSSKHILPLDKSTSKLVCISSPLISCFFKYVSEVKIHRFLIFMLMGSGANWVLPTALAQEIPYFELHQPEGLCIATFMNATNNFGFLMMTLYTILHEREYVIIPYRYSVPVLLTVSSLGCFFAATVYPFTAFHHTISICLYLSCAIGGTVGALSSVVFNPFMTAYTSDMISAARAGGSAMILLTALLSLAQSPGSVTGPRFSVSVYLSIFGTILILPTLCYLYIQNTGIGLRHKQPQYEQQQPYELSNSSNDGKNDSCTDDTDTATNSTTSPTTSSNSDCVEMHKCNNHHSSNSSNNYNGSTNQYRMCRDSSNDTVNEHQKINFPAVTTYNKNNNGEYKSIDYNNDDADNDCENVAYNPIHKNNVNKENDDIPAITSAESCSSSVTNDNPCTATSRNVPIIFLPHSNSSSSSSYIDQYAAAVFARLVLDEWHECRPWLRPCLPYILTVAWTQFNTWGIMTAVIPFSMRNVSVILDGDNNAGAGNLSLAFQFGAVALLLGDLSTIILRIPIRYAMMVFTLCISVIYLALLLNTSVNGSNSASTAASTAAPIVLIVLFAVARFMEAHMLTSCYRQVVLVAGDINSSYDMRSITIVNSGGNEVDIHTNSCHDEDDNLNIVNHLSNNNNETNTDYYHQHLPTATSNTTATSITTTTTVTGRDYKEEASRAVGISDQVSTFLGAILSTSLTIYFAMKSSSSSLC